MKDLILFVLACILVLVLGTMLDAVRWALPAEAQSVGRLLVPCGDFLEFDKELADKYGEQKAGTGQFDTAKTTVLIYVNPNTHSFTILLKTGDIACTPAAGKDWKFIPIGEPT